MQRSKPPKAVGGIPSCLAPEPKKKTSPEAEAPSAATKSASNTTQRTLDLLESFEKQPAKEETCVDQSDIRGPRRRPQRTRKPTEKAISSKPKLAKSKKRKASNSCIHATPEPTTASVAFSSPLSWPPNMTPLPTPSSAKTRRSSTRTLAPPSSAQSQASLTMMPTISPHKQRYTILRASCASSIIGVVPLKLRSCMTMDDFFSSIITATGYANQEREISTIMVTFDFKEDSDNKKSMFVRKDVMDSFEVFLEMIDEAPCWKEEGGRCEFAVDVVLP